MAKGRKKILAKRETWKEEEEIFHTWERDHRGEKRHKTLVYMKPIDGTRLEESCKPRLRSMDEYLEAINSLVREAKADELRVLLQDEFIYPEIKHESAEASSGMKIQGKRQCTREFYDHHNTCMVLECVIESGLFSTILANAKSQANGTHQVLLDVFAGLDLSDCDFGDLDLSGEDVPANFSNAKLIGAKIGRANLTGVRFDHTDAKGSDLTQAQADSLGFCQYSRFPKTVKQYWSYTTTIRVSRHLQALKRYGEALDAGGHKIGHQIVAHAEELQRLVSDAPRHDGNFTRDFLAKLHAHDALFRENIRYRGLVNVIATVVAHSGMSDTAVYVCEMASVNKGVGFFASLALVTREKQLVRDTYARRSDAPSVVLSA